MRQCARCLVCAPSMDAADKKIPSLVANCDRHHGHGHNGLSRIRREWNGFPRIGIVPKWRRCWLRYEEAECNDRRACKAQDSDWNHDRQDKFASCGVHRIAARLCPFARGMCCQPGFIDPAIKYLNKDSAMPNRMPHVRESEKWPDQ
jgi:hypothetical protein